MMLDDDDDDVGPTAAERTFFAALRAGDAPALDEVLADGFVMIDTHGAELVRRDFLRDVEQARLRFDGIHVVASRLRRYGDAAVFTGSTSTRRRFGAIAWSVRTRFTHVLVVERGRFRLASAHDVGVPR